jgi:mRNA-decapping enzyme subunit 2
MATASTPLRHYNTPPEDILDDISSRFIINVPEDERYDITRMMFQIELAHWFYLDIFCDEIASLPKLSFKNFTCTIFGHVPFLQTHLDSVEEVMEGFRNYKSNVPTYGCIIVCPELKNCLMVQGFWAKSSWGFPKGKVNHSEEAMACAIREVREETGFDCTPYINEKDYIERTIRGTIVRLYIVPGVSMDESFSPKTKNEIKDIRWFDIASLPDSRDRGTGIPNTNQFFMAIPFVQPLRKWIANQKRSKHKKRKTSDNKAPTPQMKILPRPVTPPVDTKVYVDLMDLLASARLNEAPVMETNIRVENTVTKGFGTSRWLNANLNIDWPRIWSETYSELGIKENHC